MTDEAEPEDKRRTIGRIPLKQVRVKKGAAAVAANPMNKLVPYLDLFARLDDDELSRLADIGTDVVAELRQQVVAIDRALARYTDLLPRLGDQELVRLTGATPKTVRFWRLCQPRVPAPRSEAVDAKEEDGVVARAAAAKATTGPVATVPAEPPDRQVTDTPLQSPSGGAGNSAASESGTYPIAGPATQAAVSQMMAFSGDPFPGFDDSAAGFEGLPTPEEADIALEDIEADELNP